MRVKELLTMALAETTACNYAFQQLYILLLRFTFFQHTRFWNYIISVALYNFDSYMYNTLKFMCDDVFCFFRDNV